MGPRGPCTPGIGREGPRVTPKLKTQTGVRPMIERYPLAKAADAYDQMISGRARFRVVLTVAS